MGIDRHRPRICIVVAAPLTLKAFMLRHVEALSGMADVTMVADFSSRDDTFPWPGGVTRIAIPIARAIAPWKDFRSLLLLFRLFRQHHFDLVHSVTPKAGLLTMIAGWLARVPLRMHMFTGQVWATRKGPMRSLLKSADRLTAGLATRVLADSRSQRDFLITQGIVPEHKSAVLAQGSICGVDTERFRPDPVARERIRNSLGIAPHAVLFLYLGRINRDKGLPDLAQAFANTATLHPDMHLLLVGPDEENLAPVLSTAVGACIARLHIAGLTERPQEYFAAADVFCLPSYREGFGTTIIEAAAAGIPAIGSRIYGVTDAIVEGESGLLFNPGNVGELGQSMGLLASDTRLRRHMGENARKRAIRDFSSHVVTAALLAYYQELLANDAD